MAITLTTSYQLLAQTNLGSFGYGTLYLREYGKYDSQSIGNNTTTYTLKLAIYCAGSYCNSGNCYAYISGTCVQNNTSLTFPTNGEITLGAKTSTVTHNGDGTRYVEEGGSFSCYAGTNGSVNAGFNLPTIPRASTIACTTANIGETAIITIDRKSSSFTHTIQYLFGDLSGTIVTKTSNTIISWTIPTSFYTKIPNNKTGRGTLTCYTFDADGNTVGNTTSVDFTVTVNTENNKPDVTISAVDTGLTLPTGVTTTSLTGSNKILINNWSSVKVTATATAKNSATIKSTTIKCGDGQSSSSLTPTFTKVHSKDFSIITTDSREISNNTSTSDLTLIAYTEIQTTEIILKRISQTSGTIKLSLKGNYFNGSFGSVTNDITLKYRYRIVGGSWSPYTVLQLTKSDGTFSYNNDELLTNLDYQIAYNFELVLTDKINVYPISATISKGVPVFDYGENDFNVNATLYLDKKPQLIRALQNVEELKEARCIENELIKTNGFYENDDGGGAIYKIISNLKEDNFFIHKLDNGLFAKLVIEKNCVNIKQIGARPQKTDGTKYDVAQYINAYISKLDEYVNRFKLYIPAGIWHCSGVTISRYSGFEIFGDEAFNCNRADGTIITSLNDNQDYILQIGNTSNYTENWVFKNITISSTDFEYSEQHNCFVPSKNVKKINLQALNFLYANFGITDNLFFYYIDGKAFKITSCWENYFKLLNFRKISNHNSSIMCFGEVDTTLLSTANISACNFEKIMFEGVHGDLIEFETKCSFTNSHFGVINFEDYISNMNGEVYTTYTDENIETFDEDTANHLAIFKVDGELSATVVDSIEMNNVSFRFFEYNGNIYTYDTIVKIEKDYAHIGLNISNISIVGMKKNMRILKSNVKSYMRNRLCVGNIVNNSEKDFWFDVEEFTDITCNGSIKSFLESKTIITNDFIEAYSIVKPYTTRGMLYYDKDSYNRLNLCAKPLNTGTHQNRVLGSLIVGGTSIILRAKIPTNQTFILTLVNLNDTTKYVDLNLTGTGVFSYYTINLSSELTIGDYVDFKVSSNNTGIDCLIDCFKFIN